MKRYLSISTLLAVALIFGANPVRAKVPDVAIMKAEGTETYQASMDTPGYVTKAVTTKSILKQYATAGHPLENLVLVFDDGDLMVGDKTDGSVVQKLMTLTVVNVVQKNTDAQHRRVTGVCYVLKPIGFNASDLSANTGTAGGATFVQTLTASGMMTSLKIKAKVGTYGTALPAYSRIFNVTLTRVGKYTGP